MSVRANHRVEIERHPEWGYDCVRFRATRAPERGAKTPVRIFLGTEASQWRAERVFLWSVTRFGDPGRDYEVHRMADLAGFDPRKWTTGFTNYRFAIPSFAAGRGRAIYNDVDQIYLADPAALYDLDLGGRAFLARAPNETSVMLLDCGRMRETWNLAAARAETKKGLHARAAPGGTRCGALPTHWNARDGEYDPKTPGVLHLTTLHTQPWRPFPHQFFYEPHPLEKVWTGLEAEADAAGFDLYTPSRPSGRFASWIGATAPRAQFPVEPLAALAAASGIEKIERFSEEELRAWLDAPRAADTHEGLGCIADWSHLPAEDQGWILDVLFEGALKLLVLIDQTPRVDAARAFEARVERAAKRHPGVTWHLRSEGSGTTRFCNGGPAPSQHRGEPPRVWVLRDDRVGNTTQSLGLAQSLAWPWQEKPLEFDRRGRATAAARATLAPPWPDLVIAAGQRTAAVALELREHGHGVPRLVQLGRKGGAAAEPFDLVVTPRAARLWPHPKRVETLLPVCRETAPVELSGFGEAAPPRVALLIGGSTARIQMDAPAMTRLARDTRALLADSDATLWVSTSRRSPADTPAIVARELPEARLYEWRPNDRDNPYAGLLSHADLLIVTAESESMLAEAAATDAALVIARVGRIRPPTLAQRIGERIVARARRRPENERGTPLPQRGFEHYCAGLVANGRVRPLRDLGALQRELVESGRAHFLEDALRDPARLRRPVQAIREAHGVAQRVRALFESGAGRT